MRTDRPDEILREITPMYLPDRKKSEARGLAYLLIAVTGGFLGLVVAGPDFFIGGCVAGFLLGYVLLSEKHPEV
jgi:hypothetical protein